MSGVLGDRTVQTLNTKTDALNDILWEAVRELKKIVVRAELRGRAKNHISREETEAVARVRQLVKKGASIDHSLVLHRAIANGFERRQIEYLVRLGGNVNLQEPRFGGFPIHLAAANHNAAIPWLLDLGADKRVKDRQGRTAISFLQKKWKEFEVYSREERVDVTPEECQDHLSNAMLLMPPSQKKALVNGWLSPRMAYQLLRSAQLEGDAISDGCGNLSYIPDTLWRCSGQTSAFLLGYQACYVAAAHYLRKGKAPTVDLIRASSSPAIRCIRGYLAQGGKIEYALDAMIDLACQIEEDDLEYDNQYLELPTTALDDAFEVAKVMCIDLGGGKLEEKGPHVTRYQDEESVSEAYVDRDSFGLAGPNCHRRDSYCPSDEDEW